MTHVEPSPQRTAPQPTGSFPNAWTLFRVQGVPVRLDRSLLLIMGLVVFWYFGDLQQSLPGYPPAAIAVVLLVCIALFFVSILAHEIGHAMASLGRGIPVVAITLFALGGVTESTREADRARDEFIIVGIGPFVSLVLAAVFGLLSVLLDGVPVAGMIAGVLGWLNLVLAVFNVVPAYPLDGGRLLRSILWAVTGAPHKATRWAARVGQAFAGMFIAYMLYRYFASGASGLGGLWNVLIGFFLFQGATTSHKRARMREQLNRVRVADLMGSVPPALPAAMTLREALAQVQQRPSLLWPVGDPLRGTLLLGQIDAVPDERWDSTTVASIATDPTTSSIEIDRPLDDAVDLMARSPENMLVVTDRGSPVGLLTPSLVSDSL